MVRQVGQVSYNTFIRGLITEAGPLTFPDNASTEDMNCVLSVKGSHRRRYGIEEEADGTPFSFTEVYNTFKRYSSTVYTWKSPGNDGSKTFLVIQICNILYFYDISNRTSITYNRASLSINMASFIINEDLFKKNGCSFTSGKGCLFVSGKGIEPFYVSYNTTTGTLTSNVLNITIRDTEGLDDGLLNNAQPSSLSLFHEYNLLNQGWIYPSTTVINPGLTSSVSCSIGLILAMGWAFDVPLYHVEMPIYINNIKVTTLVLDNPLGVTGTNIKDAFNAIPEEQRLFISVVSGENLDTFFPVLILSTTNEHALATVGTKIQFGEVPSGGVEGYWFNTMKSNTDISEYLSSTPYIDYKNSVTNYPSNAQQWFIGREVQQRINVDEVKNFNFGNQKAPRGYFFLNAFTENRSQYFPSIPDAIDEERVIDIAFLGGRVFYLRNNQVLYSQVLTNINNAEKCYQEGDPTSEDAFDLVDTDGGVITINDMGGGQALFELANGLLVLASNGIWTITGLSQDDGFKATSYSVRKISSIDCISRKSIINVNGAPIFWSSTGIYTIQAKEYSGYEVVSLSSNTIQALYKNIPTDSLRKSQGIYDEGSQKVYWIYNEDEEEEINLTKCTKGLVFDVRLKAFYEMCFNKEETHPFICGFFTTPWLSSISFDEEVLDNSGSLILDNSDEIVYTKIDINNTELTSIKWLSYENVSGIAAISVCNFNNLSFKDWQRSNREGVDYDSYFTTGYNVVGESASTKDVIYMVTQLSRTENNYLETEIMNQSSCKMQMRWDFEDNSYSHKWTEPVQIYRNPRIFAPTLEDPNFDKRGMPVITTKHKVRGSGRALQIKFTSEPGKNFEVLGFSMMLGSRSY